MAIRVLVAPDKFKDCLTADQVSAAIAHGIATFDPTIEIDVVPMADGGEGTVAALVRATNGRVLEVPASGPFGEAIPSFFGVLNGGNTAVIEMAAASGLALVKVSDRDPRRTTTAGVGDLIRAALDQNVEQIVIGIGGSATNDGGAGMAQRLGFRLLDRDDKDIPFGGQWLKKLHRIDASHVDARIRKTKFVAACDVENTLCGPQGASAVYGPQKGAEETAIAELDAGLQHFAEIVRRDLGVDLLDLRGGGAAGGLGAGLVAFCHAKLQSGFDLISNVVGLEERIRRADLVVTAEGRYDASSRFGKTAHGVCELAGRWNIPAVMLAGDVRREPISAEESSRPLIFSIVPGPISLEESLRYATQNLAETARQVVQLFLAGKSS